MLVLGKFGFGLDFFIDHVDDEGFMSDAWLDAWYAPLLEGVKQYIHEMEESRAERRA